ncbi:MAG: phage portal protein [Terriglobales bacterium]
MGLVASLFRASAPAPNWLDDRYWSSHGGHDTAAGIRVSPESALRANAVYSCVNIRKETLATLPCIVYKRLPNGDKERAPQHPNYRLLHDQPNSRQTSFEWFEMMQAHLDLRGNAYSLKEPGLYGPVSQLWPLHPDRVTPTLYTDNSIDYTVRALDGTTSKYSASQILHLRGWSQDGVIGLSPISAQRDTIGVALASQDYVARFLKNDISPSIVLEHPALLDEEAYKRLQESTAADNTGENRHKAMILEEGLKANKIGMSNRDAQIIESDKLTDGRIASTFRVPPHMINFAERATHSNAEQYGLEFRSLCMLPIAKRWEGMLARDLFFPLYDDPTCEYFAEFLLDGLSRGDQQSRYVSYSIGRNWGWLSANDVRRLENMNSIGDQGDEYLRPLNMTIEGIPQPKQIGAGSSPAGEGGGSSTGNDDDPDNADEQASATRNRLFALAESAASRMVRKEISALASLVAKHKQAARELLKAKEVDPSALNKNAETFVAKVRQFYAEHSSVIAASLRIDHDRCARWCATNGTMLCNLAKGGNWDQLETLVKSFEGNVRALAAMAMGEAN